MSKEWKAEETDLNRLNQIISMYHHHLADLVGQIMITFKEKGGKVTAKTVKLNSMVSALCDHRYIFVISIDYVRWSKMSDMKRNQLLDHQLCYIQGEENKDGEMIYTTVKPDVCYFSEEMKRHGAWRNESES